MQRWSDEVARDPASLAFLPLARAYRRQGQRSAARELCLRGLEHYPSHAEAHSLLALLYLEDGDRTKAADEWSMVLRMDPNHFEALRGIGFCYLEQDQLSRARQALERAALLRPQDAAVQEALKVLGTRQELHSHGTNTNAIADGVIDMGGTAPGTTAPAAPIDEPWADSSGSVTPYPEVPASAPMAVNAAPFAPNSAAAGFNTAASAPPESAPPFAQQPQVAQPGQPAQNTAPVVLSSDPMLLFESMSRAGPLLGILLLDAQGLIMAGTLGDGAPGSAETLGATLGPAINEAGRTVSLLKLGAWRGMLIEAGTAVLHVSPVTSDAVVLLAAKRSAPTGWVLRSAAQAAELASRYIREYA